MTMRSLLLPDDADSTRFGAVLARALRKGDTVLLSGPIGAGKTHIARALIQARIGRAEDVPSPTFTLVQTYEADVEIWHADFYRLTSPDEVFELGLDSAFETAICLIEWPDRAGDTLPPDALRLDISVAGEGRTVALSGGRPGLLQHIVQAWELTDRKALSNTFLANADWGHADREFLAGDASDRSYDRLRDGTKTAVLMDAPPGKGDDPATFIRIAKHLAGLGLSPPRILAQDLDTGFLLIEDLGDDLFARLVLDRPDIEPDLYRAATDVLIHLQSHPAAPDLPDLSAHDWAQAAAFALDWYAFAITGIRAPTDDFVTCLTGLMKTYADGPRVMILRDYHAENLLWLPDRSGLARTGLLDFQLAQMGQPGYDLVSLLQDARRDVPISLEADMKAHFAKTTGATGFEAAYATLGAQRALRILGIFARLCLTAGKPHYTNLIPRVWDQLQRNLAHPALADLAKICARLLPEPTPQTLERIRTQCGKFPTR